MLQPTGPIGTGATGSDPATGALTSPLLLATAGASLISGAANLGSMFGVATTGMGTYTSVIRPDGSIHGDGQGLITTPDGELVTWTGSGLGKFGAAGAISYRGMLFFHTASANLARLNNTCGAFEYEVDASGSTVSKVWEWK